MKFDEFIIYLSVIVLTNSFVFMYVLNSIWAIYYVIPSLLVVLFMYLILTYIKKFKDQPTDKEGRGWKNPNINPI